MSATPTFGAALRFWFKLGWISFGGPAGQIAIMHEELVERKKWISTERYLHALNYCMILPGPEAQQLATYCGWLLHGTWGGVAAGTLFILPGFFILAGLSWLYLIYGQIPAISAALVGVQCAVVAIAFHAAWRIGKKSIKSWTYAAIAIGAFVGFQFFQLPFPLILGLAALAGFFLPRTSSDTVDAVAISWASVRRRCQKMLVLFLLIGALPLLLLGIASWWPGTLGALPVFFTKLALVTFGGAYAVLPYLAQQATEVYHWLTPKQMMAGLALGETTPGPLIMIVTFVGFLAGWKQGIGAAWLGAGLATFYTFLPSFFFILAGAPLIEKLRDRAWVQRALSALSAAVTGIIGTLGFFFAAPVFLGGGQPYFSRVLFSLLCFILLVRGTLTIFWLVPGAALAGWWLQTMRLPYF